MKLSSPRIPANLSLDSNLVAEARLLRINLSRAAETGIEEALAKEKARLWLLENAAAIKSSNDFVERNGLPLAGRRQF